MSDHISITEVLSEVTMRRNYFSDDAKFFNPDIAAPILRAYDEASKEAASSARHAIRYGTLESIRIAQWDEAVARTIEAVLCALPSKSDECPDVLTSPIDLPDRPAFK